MKNQQAFTLMEVIVAISIIAILAAISIPKIQYMLAGEHDKSVHHDIVHLLEYARGMAAVSHQSISICKSSDQQSCKGSWSDSQLMFYDATQDGELRDTGQIISVSHVNLFGGKLYVRSFPIYREYLSLMSPSSLVNDNGTVWYCHNNALNPVWAVQVHQSIFIKSIYPNKNGEVKDVDGKILKC